MEFFGPMPEPPHTKPRMHNVLPNSRAYIRQLGQQAQNIGIDVRVGTRATRFLLDGERVVGVAADLGDGLRLIPTPGHTPGHVSLEVETGGELLVITGDILHHQFQLARPDIAEVADIDRPLAVRSRTDFFSEHAGTANVVAGTHFGIAPVGHIEAHGGAWRWTATPGTAVSP